MPPSEMPDLLARYLAGALSAKEAAQLMISQNGPGINFSVDDIADETKGPKLMELMRQFAIAQRDKLSEQG